MVKPRICSLPSKQETTLGRDAVAFARDHGLELDDHQAFVLEQGMAGTADRWAYSEVGFCEPRQNGKTAVLEARILAEVFLVGSELTIYSAHLYDTSMEIFRRLWSVIEENEDLLAQVKPTKYGLVPQRTTGFEGYEFTGNRRVRFRTRTKKAGRGYSCDCLLLDEAMFLPEFDHGALVPTLSARKNPQIWYAGSAVDQLVHEHGVVFTRLREFGQKAEGHVGYFEWSVEGDDPERVSPDVLGDRAAWAQANPALGARIDADWIDRVEYRGSMGPRQFAVERLGIGDWPRTDHASTNPIDFESWQDLADPGSKRGDSLAFALDVSPDRRASISVASVRTDGLFHVEVVEDRSGTAWLPGRMAELVKKWKPSAVVCDGYGPGASVVDALEKLNVEVQTLSSAEHAQACGRLVDSVNEGVLRHLGQAELTNAVRSAQTRPLGDAWAWSRKNSSVNISPLVSVTLALSAAMTVDRPTGELLVAWA